MKRSIAILLLICVLIFSVEAGNVLAANVGLRPVDTGLLNQQGQIQVPVGSNFGVEVYFTGLSEYSNDITVHGGLTSFLVDIPWSQLIGFSSAQGLSILSGNNGFFSAQLSNNVLEIGGTVGNQYSPITDNSFVLATLNLVCSGAGLTSLATTPHFTFGDYNWSLADGAFFLNETGSFYQGIGINQVNPVPIPAAVWLLGSGVVGLVALKRRKKA